MPLPALSLRNASCDAGRSVSVDSGITKRDHAVYRFAAFQLFSTIYLQKIAVGTLTFQVRVPLVLMTAGVAWAVVTRMTSFSPARWACTWPSLAAACSP
jgi:hypothetical protein